ncbi:neuroglian-like [Tachypleus tridentatus]|uniref:neuroglian-like n=1 Tax=Tachypleus tridentatus TaxID=6853 RepID=UPI003FD5FB7C
MTISNLVKTDTAVYQCNGSNIHGYTFKNFYLNILSIPPTMQEPPKNITYAVVGSKRIIKCLVYGVPQPQVNWKKDNQELVGSRFQTSNSGILELTNISKEDEGQYTCIATNKYGSLQASGNLEVKAKTKITLAPENVEVSINKKAVLHCEAEADPTLPLTIKWHFNGEPIDYHLDTRLIQTEDQSFVINMAKDSDSGIYTCIAETFIDKDSAWANLIVQNVPEPPVFKEVKCEVHVADIQWEPRGNGHAPILGYNIQYNTSFNPNVWENSFLNVPPTDTHFKVLMSPWTNYTFRVVAFNKIGSSQPSEHSKQCSTPLDTPHKHPSNVKGEGTNPDNIVISWKPMPKIEHNAPGLFYKVFWKRDDIPDSRWNVVTIRDWKQESFLVDQQPTFKPYKIKVEAHNSLGNAKITAPEVIGYSGEDVPLEAPQNFQLLMILDGRRAKFAWNAVSSTSIRGHFKGYKVRTWAIGDGQHWREQDFSPNATEGIVTVLKPFAKNFAEVAVINQRYIGPPSQTITFTTPQGVPGAVASFSAYPLGINSLYLIWKKPDEANGILTGYKIFYSEVNGTILGIKKEHLPPLSNPDATRLKLTGLIPQTKYRVTIQATTQVGAGEPRYIEVMTGSEDHKVPGVPIFIWSQIHDDKEDVILKVTWLPALDDHLGSHFFVQYRLKGDSAWTNTISELENDYTMITNLEMNAVYELRVVSVDGPYETPSLIAEVKIGNHAAPFVQPVEESGIPLWLIAPVCCIILLAIILVIIYLVRQNAGGKYPVYEKEVALGSENNCLDEGGFDEYNKPSSNHHLLNGSRVSLASSLAPPLSETDSMAEYGGEGDTGKFTEDGSFIGQYGKVKSPEEESGLSTPASPLV